MSPIATLLAGIFALAALSACGPDRSPPVSASAEARRVCSASTFRYQMDPAPRPYSQMLAEQCWRAADALAAPGDTITAWHATLFVDRLAEFERGIAGLSHFPNRYGEYLIGRETGLNAALDAWILSESFAYLRAPLDPLQT